MNARPNNLARSSQYLAASGREFDHGRIIRIARYCQSAAKTDLYGTHPARRDGGQYHGPQAQVGASSCNVPRPDGAR